MIWNNKIEWC